MMDYTRIPDKLFQPTPPAQGATVPSCPRSGGKEISTHAPRAGGDIAYHFPAACATIFQPTPPAQGATSEVL